MRLYSDYIGTRVAAMLVARGSFMSPCDVQGLALCSAVRLSRTEAVENNRGVRWCLCRDIRLWCPVRIPLLSWTPRHKPDHQEAALGVI